MISAGYIDHTLYPFRALQPDRAATVCRFPAGTKVAVHLVLALQSFPLAQRPHIGVPGMLERHPPDLTYWSQRKLALREGLWRIDGLLARLGLPASLAVEADALPELAGFPDLLRTRRLSVVAAGVNAATLHSGFPDREAEALAIRKVLARLGAACGAPVTAWHSPSGVHSPHTMELLAANGVRTLLDLNNDELPLRLQTAAGEMLHLPWQHFASDLHCLHVCKQDAGDYFGDITQGLKWLQRESQRAGPRIFTLPLHPWISGVPHRFKLLEAALREWTSLEGVSFMNHTQIEETLA